MDPMNFLRMVVDYASNSDFAIAYLDLNDVLTLYNDTEPFEEQFQVTITPL
jgi:hypothetical protein